MEVFIFLLIKILIRILNKSIFIQSDSFNTIQSFLEKMCDLKNFFLL